MDWGLVIVSGVVGLAVGSFLNVVILRLPKDESLAVPASHCTSCGAELKWYHNVPVLSWLALRGKCAFCDAPISWQYPAVEIATAAIWGANVALYGPTGEAARAIVLLTLLLAIAVTDAKFYIIPDELSLGGAVVGVALAGALQAWSPPVEIGLKASVIGAVVGSGVLWLVAVIGTWAFKKDAMGGGDIKMLAMIGAFLGWKGALLTIFLGALAGTIVFVPIAYRTDKLVPFGLFLALGAALAFYLGDPLLEWYVGFLS